MKRFETIEIEIEYNENLSSPTMYGKKLLSELKQITDEHSEMVGMLVKCRTQLILCTLIDKSGQCLSLVDEIETSLTKINNK